MDPTTRPVTINRADGSAVTLPKLTVAKLIEYERAFALDRKLRLAENLRICGASPELSLRALSEFDARRIRTDESMVWANTLAGRVEAVRLALSMTKSAATIEDVAALGLGPAELLAAAAGVLDLRLVQNPPDGASGPPTAAGAVTPPCFDTGSASATPSTCPSTSSTPSLATSPTSSG